mmetsp:Transcript_54063/g.114820  ORF Transcript_54063/g.114820 Transcript_54063/m.114820 type:complete len:209 (+) Transcript_54063:255-881(+)
MLLRVPCFFLSALTSVAAFSSFSPAVQNVAAAPSSKSTLFLSLKELDDSNMKDLLFQPIKSKAVLVDAYAPWCGPCKLIEPYLDECAKKYSDQLSIVKYDVEGNNNKNLKVEMLLQGVMVRGLPTLVLYNNGNPLAIHSGVITETELEDWLNDSLFSKMVESESEVMQFTRNKLQEEEKKEADEKGANGEKRGFVSFASRSGRDDYAL